VSHVASNFFFQAEDGIRVFHVTGVQTCALPIFHASDMGSGVVRGIQSQGVGTSLKHFAANNQETDRMRVSSDVDPRPLREIYLRSEERRVGKEGSTCRRWHYEMKNRSVENKRLR